MAEDSPPGSHDATGSHDAADSHDATDSNDAMSGLEAECCRHLDFVRKNCPGLLPDGPVTPGTPIDPIPVGVEQATALVRAALRQAAAGQVGLRPTDPAAAAVGGGAAPASLPVLLASVTGAPPAGW